MGLKEYNQKRDFRKTSEPEGNTKSGKSKLRFVVQKHAAKNLHYDFRLELEGVLKSWAVPKGPSLDTKVKRLAMHVEDHPYDYRNFEGGVRRARRGGGRNPGAAGRQRNAAAGPRATEAARPRLHRRARVEERAAVAHGAGGARARGRPPR